MSQPLLSLLTFALAAALAPLLATAVGRLVRVPLVVIEIMFGIVAGPTLLGWIQDEPITATLARLGAVTLFYLAGYEIDTAAIRGRPIRNAFLGWGISIALGIAVGIAVGSSSTAGIYIGICLATTTLSTIAPVLRDAGQLQTPFGRGVIAAGTAGEFGPLLALALLLSGRSPIVAAIALIAFAAVTLAGFWLATRGLHPVLRSLIDTTLRTSGQFAVRLIFAIVAVLATVSIEMGLDMLVGAFIAGMVGRILLADVAEEERSTIEAKVEAVGFGLLIPIFFVHTGVTFDLRGLLGDPRSLMLLPAILVALIVVRGIPSLLSVAPGASRRSRIAHVLFSATGLAVIVAVANQGGASGDLSSTTVAALIGAGMLSVLFFPLIALSVKEQTIDLDQSTPGRLSSIADE
ncbi:MAG: cation:proton antiporter [Thermomicrobiales bacterium]